MSSDLSGEITAIATVALAAFAIITAAFAFLAYREQSREVAVLMEQNQREIAERRRAQAARVFADISRARRGTRSWVDNRSDLPIYDIEFWDTRDTGHNLKLEFVAPVPRAVMPGAQHTVVLPSRTTPGPILTFRDAAGVRWIRMPDGTLTEQSRSTPRESILAALAETPPPEAEPNPTAGPDQGQAETQGE